MRMIALFTDFTLNGPYVGQMHAVLGQLAPGVCLVDLMHDAPRCDPRAAACLLARIVAPLPDDALVLAVVDPGVGDPGRRAVVLEADGRCFVGPDNGLLESVARTAKLSRWWQITWQPPQLSDSFHGRDLFAPVAAQLATGTPLEQRAHRIPAGHFADWPTELAEVIYVDAFGNLITGLDAGDIDMSARLAIAGNTVAGARTFSAVPEGELFWYHNSMGLVEIAQNRGNAALSLGCGIGTPVEL